MFNSYLDTETQSHGECSNAATRPATPENTNENTRRAHHTAVLYFASVFSGVAPLALHRRALCVSVLRSLLTLLLLLTAAAAHAQPAKPATLKIGVTLHPYYSWTANVVGKLPGYEVRALLPGDIDAGDYQPRPEDIRKLADLDAIVVNGIGHDDFIFPMLKASGNARAVIIRVNAETPLIRSGTGSVNSHTFISFSNAIQQTYAIQRELSRLRPQDRAVLEQNAADYARRLRTIKAGAATRLAGAKITRVVTVHDGYGYLLQEFGLEVAGVVQPAHGLTPSAAELRDMVALLKREKIAVVFSEATFPAPLLNVLRDEARVTVHIISHIASGPFTATRFEEEMQRNVETMVRALAGV
jgi:zinc transport system substrate-binding protein